MALARSNLYIPSHGETVTKSDSTVVNYTSLYVGGAGDVAVLFKDDAAAVTFKAVPVGTTINGAIVRVMSTNTTATLLIGMV